MADYTEDIRALRRSKKEDKVPWLVWRKGKFSPEELAAIRRGLDEYVSETCTGNNSSREEVLENLKWARENKLRVWCNLATRCSLPDRKIGSIRHCILRRMLPGCEVKRWSKEQTLNFARLQELYGERAWKQIAKETGRTLEDVINKGRDMARSKRAAQKPTRFTTNDTLRVKLARLVKAGDDANLYEFNAIAPDCKLVALVRRYFCPDGNYNTIHEIPSGRIADKLGTIQNAVRFRWHHFILPNVISRVNIKLGNEELVSAFLVLQARRACKGKLVDIEGKEAIPAYDMNGVPWRALMPLWPQGVSETRLTSMLRNDPKFGIKAFPDVVKSATRTVLLANDKEAIIAAAMEHFDEIRSILNAIADRGDAYIKEDRKRKTVIHLDQ